MASCECCWDAMTFHQRVIGTDIKYSEVCRQHEEEGCLCTQNTPEGRRKQAGQFWDDTLQRDSREPADRGGK